MALGSTERVFIVGTVIALMENETLEGPMWRMMNAVILLAMVGCARDLPAELDPAEMAARVAELEDSIDELISDGSCATDSCESAAVGAKACGGPEYYVVYCADGVDEAELTDLIDEHRQLSELLNQSSDCEFVEAPEIHWSGGVCEVVPL